MTAASFDDEVLTTKSSAPQLLNNAADLDSDFGDQDAMSTGDGLDRIQPADKKSKVRCAVLTNVVKPKKAWIHFIQKGDKKAVYRCLTERDKKNVPIGPLADCCKKLNHDDDQKAQLIWAVLSLKYRNSDPTTGKYPVPVEGQAPTPVVWELGWLKLSRAGYKQISELVQEGEQAYDFDFTVAYKDNGIGYDYKRVSQKARWRLNEELVKEVIAEAEKFKDGTLLANRLGKVVSAVDMKAILAGQSAAATTSTKNIDDTRDL